MPSAPQALPKAMSKRSRPDLSSRLNATRWPPASSTATVSGAQLVSRPFFRAASTMVDACASVTTDMFVCSRFERLWRGRHHRLALLQDVDRSQLHRLPQRALVVDGAIGRSERLARTQNLLRLPILLEPELALDHQRHGNAGMEMTAGLEAGGDLDGGVDQLLVGAGHVHLLQDGALDRRR